MQPATRFSNQPLGGVSGDWRHRLLHFHIPLALASVGVIFLWMSLPLFLAVGHQSLPQTGTLATSHPPSEVGAHQSSSQAGSHPGSGQANDTNHPTNHSGGQTANVDGSLNRLSVGLFTSATGYVALGLLALILLIGPANLLLGRRNPISSYLRRDVGTWTAIVSVIHVIAGFFVHGPPAPFGERVLYYFFASDGSPLNNRFGLGNWTGLAATVIVVGLLALSSDLALQKLKARPWKWLQRLNYALFGLVILHAIYYGALLRVTSPSTLLLGFSVVIVFVGQVVGVWLWRQRHARTVARPSA